MTCDLSMAFLRSLATRLVVLVVAFAAVPAVLAHQFLRAETAKRATLLHVAQSEGRLIAEGLRMGMERLDKRASILEVRTLVERIDARGINMRLLLRPVANPDAVYLIAASPPLSAQELESERRQLIAAGIVDRIPRSCDRAAALDVRYQSSAQQTEVVSSMTPFASPAGCWAIVTSHSSSDAVGYLLGRPYWGAPEVTLGAAIYAVLAVLVLFLFGNLWRGLVLFARQARDIGSGTSVPSFVESSKIPELTGVAQEFDRMVSSLRASAVAFRQAAEDNAHAFKTPLATIAQSLEPVRRGVDEGNARAQRSLQLIEQSVNRLDALVTAARRMDEASASLVNPPHQRIDLSRLAWIMLDTYKDIAAEKRVRFVHEIGLGCYTWAGTELLETVIENIVDNAISFSPPNSCIMVRLRRVGSQLSFTVEDEGPGATTETMATMFERYVSCRPGGAQSPGEQHFGIGLWLVRRNVESVGGTVHAENRESGGLRITVVLQAAK